MSEKLIRASDARKAILNIDPKSAYCIDSVQAVDAVPVVHGRWDDECRCTACGWYGDDIYKRLALSFDYCPNCGAKMDLEVKNYG